jgi:hypothetical protein
VLAAAVLGFSRAAAQVEGRYVAQRMETASGIELLPDARFEFFFSYGAMDLGATGRWRREGDDIVLDTDPPVRPPRVELVETGHEAGEGFVVRVTDPSGQVPPYLDAEARFASGPPAYAQLDGEAYRFEPQPGRRIVSVRVGSGAFQFWSEPFAVPEGANMMRFRFDPADLGRADFRGQRAHIEGDTLTLAMLGEPIRYRRLTADEEAGLTAEAADTPSEDIATTPPQLAVPARPVELQMDAPPDPMLRAALADYGNGMFAGTTRMELRLNLGGRQFDFGPIGGSDYLQTGLRLDERGQVGGATLMWQDRLLTSDEALERARRLEAWLREGGAVAPPQGEDSRQPGPFQAMEQAGSPVGVAQAADWASAARLLADPAVGISAMNLYSLETAGAVVMAYLVNIRRAAEREGAPAFFEEGGREWLLGIDLWPVGTLPGVGRQ